VSRTEQRLQRLERRIGLKPGPRLIYLMPNLEADEGEETPYRVKLSSEVWAHVFRRPLSSDEVKKLTDEFGRSNDFTT
jgi:hypothetical protein